ncbi:leucyl aminopeptidase family protein [Pseudahrensia aquimaris]|uniref:Leucyl aminopeptidase family protein n=1 Tax=Pseudahrensia aquimaris TaxID=744461 RepID=A0ABW3FFX1_9HYPH
MKFDTDPSALFAARSNKAVPIHTLTKDDMKKPPAALGKEAIAWAKANGFTAKSGQHCVVPDEKGAIACVLFGTGEEGEPQNGLAHGALARALPQGTYRFAKKPKDALAADLGWAMGGYDFARYRKKSAKPAKLVATGGDTAALQVQGVFMARDLINTPANDMGPSQLEKAFRKIASAHKAKVNVIKGNDLLKKNFPMVHAVGRASTDAPRVLDMKWGKASHAKITLVGKGVTFDTGGLNIKPGSSMALMKKDMGGAANVLGLAHMIMAAKLPVRLRVIVGAVENAISGNAFRPGDILDSRKGITVEIGNTDAEGRLVLGDCLTWGDEEKPELMIDMATLTGAARVALGPDLPPFYTHDDAFADALMKRADACFDPLWRMPLWAPYQSMLSSKVADVNHITSGGFGGSITAALFLSRFVENAKTWAHFDIFGWVPTDKPWAKTGGEAQAIRALFAHIERSYR